MALRVQILLKAHQETTSFTVLPETTPCLAEQATTSYTEDPETTPT